MPIFSSLFAGIGSAISGIFGFLTGGTLLSKIVVAGLSIAAQYAVQAIFGQKAPPAQASQLETRYGEDLARTIALGTVGTAGHHVYRNAYGKGNTIVQDVYVLSHFRIGGVTRLRFDGEWRELGGAVDAERGQRIQGTDAEVWVKLYLGTMDQVADAGLVSRSNPPGRWTSAHRGAGVAYAVVTSVLTREHLPNPWQAFFEVQGPALYDWRKDSTVGGTGSDRWNNQATWSGRRDNPVLQMYALERGLFNGTEMMVGKGVDASDLPIAEWSIGANICDELIATEPRYSSSCIVSSGSGVTHDANMQPILEACAGSWVELVGDEYPLVGANQASVATMTDDDIVLDEPFRLSLKRPRAELVNTVAGSFVNPETFYQSAPLAARIDETALTADRERLAVAIPYRAVTIATVADRLADIAIRAARYQASGETCVRPKFLGLRPGNWITWQSERFGWTKKFQVISKQPGAFGPKSARNVYLSLQEVSDGVFDPTAYATLPPDGSGQGAPDFQSELGNVIVAPYTVADAATGKQYPALRAIWDEPDDPTVIGVEIEYWPQFQSAAKITHPVLPSDVTVATLANGIVSNKPFAGRYRLVAHPFRITPWVDWGPVTTPNSPNSDISVYLAALQQEVLDLQRDFGESNRELREALLARVTNIVDQDFSNFSDKQEMRRELVLTREGITAAYEEKILVAFNEADGKITAVSQRVETLEVAVPLKANQSVVDSLTAIVTSQGDDITAQGAAITAINGTLAGKAEQSALTALETTVSSQGANITAQGTAITNLQSALTGYTGASAVATAFTGLNSQVSTINGQVSAQADALTSLSAATTPGNVATANLRMTVSAGPTGYAARVGFEARAGGAGTFRSAALFLDVPSGAGPTRAAIIADQFVVTSGSTAALPFVFESGTLKTNAVIATWAQISSLVTANFVAAEANIGNLTVDTIKIKNGAVTERTSASATNITTSTTNTWHTICDVTINNQSSVAPLLQCGFNLSVGGGGAASTATVQLVRVGNESNVLYEYSLTSVSGGTVHSGRQVELRMDSAPVSGSSTYRLRVARTAGDAPGAGTVTNATLTCQYNKK